MAKVGGSGGRRGVRYRLKLSAHSGGFFSLREECDLQRVVPNLISKVFGDFESLQSIPARMPDCRNPPNMQLFLQEAQDSSLPSVERGKQNTIGSGRVRSPPQPSLPPPPPARHPIPVVFVVVVVVAVSFQHDWEIISRESRGGCAALAKEDMWGGRIGAAASGDESESAFTGILFGKGGRRDVVKSIVSKMLSSISWPSFTSCLSLPKHHCNLFRI